jgi:hypothetical protein
MKGTVMKLKYELKPCATMKKNTKAWRRKWAYVAKLPGMKD